MDACWEYHAEQGRSDGGGEGPYDFTHMWDIKLEATDEQAGQTIGNSQTQTTVQWLPEGRAWVVKGKGGQEYGNGKRFDSG